MTRKKSSDGRSRLRRFLSLGIADVSTPAFYRNLELQLYIDQFVDQEKGADVLFDVYLQRHRQPLTPSKLGLGQWSSFWSGISGSLNRNQLVSFKQQLHALNLEERPLPASSFV